MSFDYGRMHELTEDIGRYLGYLKGNELVREYTFAQVAACEEQVSRLPDGFANAFPADLYTSTPQESQFVCDFYSLQIWAPFVGTDEATPESRRYFGLIAEGMEQSWNNGVAWSEAMGAQLRAICAPFTRPDPDRMTGAATDLGNQARTTLAGLLPEDFAAHSDGRNFGSTLDGWHGDAANSFQTFYDTLADRGNGYATCVGLAAGWAAAAAGLIRATQTGLLDFLETVREGLVIQLTEWAEQHGNPQDWRASDDWGIIADIGQVANDILEVIPIVNDFKKIPGTLVDIVKLISNVKSLISKANSYAGVDVVPTTTVTEFTVETAEDLYTAVTTVLYDDMLGELNDGLARLATESAFGTGMLDELQMGGDWFPHDVLPYDDGVDIFATPWIHYTDL